MAAVHLDAASAVPLHPAARAAWLAAIEDGWADPSRLYASARRARLLLDAARGAVADVLGARPDEVRFTSSGSAALTAGVTGALGGRRRVGAHVVHSAIEHSALLRAVGDDATNVSVDSLGRVDAASYAAALRDDTALACLISASHEVGTVQPVDEVAAACTERGVPLLVDAAQTVGRMPLPRGWSLLTASARKWGGPPGVGVLAVRTGTRFAVSDPGPLDLPAVVGAAAGLTAAAAESAAEDTRLRALVERIRTEVPTSVPDVVVVGDGERRLPHLVTFSVLYVDGEALVTGLDRHGFAVSSGSSCTADTLEPSHVLVAMGAMTHGNVRVSLHRGTTEEDVSRFLAVLPRVVAELRAATGVAGL